LAFLYDVQLQDFVNSRLIAPENSLSLQSVTPVAVEAQITAQGKIRLADGREYSDPSKAAAEAIFSDSWFAWHVRGIGTLNDLRQQARDGRIEDAIPPIAEVIAPLGRTVADREPIGIVIATSRSYFDVPIEDLERLLEEELDEAELTGLPHRGVSDQSLWRQALDRLKEEIAEQEPTAAAAVVFAASQAVDWAHAIGLDLTDYEVPIAILVALAVKAVRAQRPDADRGAFRNDQRDQ